MDLIVKYFHDTEGCKNEFNPPATEEQIHEAETQLNFKFPDDYKEFLRITNGFDGFVNNWYVVLESTENIYERHSGFCAEFFPWAINVGGDGGGEMFVIDTRTFPFQYGVLPCIAAEEDFIPLGNTFEKFISRLYNDTVFDRKV